MPKRCPMAHIAAWNTRPVDRLLDADCIEDRCAWWGGDACAMVRVLETAEEVPAPEPAQAEVHYYFHIGDEDFPIEELANRLAEVFRKQVDRVRCHRG